MDLLSSCWCRTMGSKPTWEQGENIIRLFFSVPIIFPTSLHAVINSTIQFDFAEWRHLKRKSNMKKNSFNKGDKNCQYQLFTGGDVGKEPTLDAAEVGRMEQGADEERGETIPISHQWRSSFPIREPASPLEDGHEKKKVRTFWFKVLSAYSTFFYFFFSLFKEHFFYISPPHPPYSPSDILREIYNKNANLKLICETLG